MYRCVAFFLMCFLKRKKPKNEIYWKLSNSSTKQVWFDSDDLHLVSSYLSALGFWSRTWISQTLLLFTFKLNFDPLPIEMSSCNVKGLLPIQFH